MNSTECRHNGDSRPGGLHFGRVIETSSTPFLSLSRIRQIISIFFLTWAHSGIIHSFSKGLAGETQKNVWRRWLGEYQEIIRSSVNVWKQLTLYVCSHMCVMHTCHRLHYFCLDTRVCFCMSYVCVCVCVCLCGGCSHCSTLYKHISWADSAQWEGERALRQPGTEAS